MRYQTIRLSIPMKGHTLPALLLMPEKRPSAPVPGVLWLHGGGYMTGMAEMAHFTRARDLAGRCGAVMSPLYPAILSTGINCPNRLEIPGRSTPGTNRPKGRCIAGEGLFPSPGHYRPHRPSQGNTGRFLGRLQGCSPFSGLHPCTLGRLAASRTTGPLVSRRGRPDSFSRSSASAPKSLPQ